MDTPPQFASGHHDPPPVSYRAERRKTADRDAEQLIVVCAAMVAIFIATIVGAVIWSVMRG